MYQICACGHLPILKIGPRIVDRTLKRTGKFQLITCKQSTDDNKPLEAIGRLLFGSVDMVAIGEMLILDDELSQTFGDNRPMEFGEGRGGWDDGNGGGREQGSDGGPEGIGEVGGFVLSLIHI